MNARRSMIVLLSLIVFGIGSGVWLSREHPGSLQAVGGPVQGPVVERALQAIAYGDQTASRDRWDPAYVAERLGADPMMHLQWVRQRSVWIPYIGVLRGSMGVLMDGQGNSLDRALLLATLLTEAGHTVRLARGDMGDAMAAELLPRLVAERREAAGNTSGAQERGWRREVQQLASLHGFDSGRLLRSVDDRLDKVTGMFRELDARTAEQTHRLGRALTTELFGTAQPDRVRSALQALRDHWWVQVQEQGRWADLDVLGNAQGTARVPAAQTIPTKALDSTLYHRVTIRLVTERASGGTMAEAKALEHTLRTADLAAGPVKFQVMPDSWQPGFPGTGGDRAATFSSQMLEQRKWRAALTIGKAAVGQAVIEASGKAGAPRGDGFGGLGGAIAGALGPRERADGELSAAWLEYEILVPGRPASIIRRQLFDLVGPAARSSARPVALELDDTRRLERSLALFRSTDILPLGSAVAPTYVAHLAAQAALANGTLLRTPAESAGSTPTAVLDRLNDLATPLPSPLYALAITRMPAALERDVFLDQPNVLTRHDFLARRGTGIEHLTATDIAANDVGATLDVPNAAAARHRQGVRDTNAEAMVYSGASGPLGSVAEAYAAGGKWVTVTSASDGFLGTLSPDLRARIADDIRTGHVVVVPASAATARDATATGWWRIDSATGGTLGVSGTGWGQSAVEKAAIIMGAVAVGWTWEYLICSGSLYVPGGNQTVSSAGRLMEWFDTPLHARALASDHCIFDAWVAGITAGVLQSMTICWPFLVKKVPGLKFFERPMFQTGGPPPAGDPPDLPRSSASRRPRRRPRNARPPVRPPLAPRARHRMPSHPVDPRAGHRKARPAPPPKHPAHPPRGAVPDNSAKKRATMLRSRPTIGRR